MSNTTHMPDNPNFATLKLKIGDTTISEVPPKHILSFEYDRVTQTEANSVTMELYDETAIELEYEIAKGKDKVEFSYGYSGGRMSKTYNATIQDYSIQFTPAGATLSIVAMTGGVSGFSQPKSKTYENMDIHNIVIEIAKEENWTLGTVEGCKPVYSEETTPDGKQVKRKFVRNNLSAVQFITNELIPYAISNSGQGDYQLYFDDSQKPPTVNFCTTALKNELTKDSLENADVSFYELEWGTGGSSRVLSFEPNYSGNLVANLGANKVEGNIINKLTNEMFKVVYDKDLAKDRPTSGNRSSIVPNEHMSLMSASSYSPDEAAKLAANMWYHASNLAYGATMTIIGDPKLEPMSMASILIVNKDGLPHHCTGAYIVTQITDSIQGGQFTSTLQLLKNALNVGVSDSGGIDISLNTEYVAIGGSSAGSTTDGGTMTPGTSGSGNAIVEEAKKYLGIPYVWGGKSPKGFDCSGLTQWCYKQVYGIDIGISTREQVKNGRAISKSEMQPGDLILNGNSPGNVSHVVIYIGDNKILHAPKPGDVVKIGNLYSGLDYPRRYV